MEYFNKQPRIGILSTSSKEGKVDSAIFGSPRMVDEKTVVMGLGNNRTLAYLRENPNAVYMIMEPGKTIMDWKGIRVYLKMKTYATSGQALDTMRSQIAKISGEQAAKMIHAAVTFEISELRPLIDMGQGWEKSI
ncbi:MAG: pyridoxamine 5'-phosphate oxidase family protein [Methanomicrobiales archaeon]|nr:pyridoxamine 5'-phosphate oxidase family protein [Methanomicrobiales archaeon]